MGKPLVIIPNYMSEESDMEILGECVQSIRQTVSNTVDILIVDDRSPEPWLVDVFESRYGGYGFELIREPENQGFSRTVNVGLARARDEGRGGDPDRTPTSSCGRRAGSASAGRRPPSRG